MIGRPKNITDSSIVPKACRERFLPLEGEYARPLTERGVNFCGVSDLRPPYEIARRDPSFHLLIFTTGGSGRFETLADSGALLPSDLWIVPAGSAHRYWTAGEWRILFFHVDAQVCTGFVPQRVAKVVPSSFSWQLESAMVWYINEVLLDTTVSRRVARSYAEVIRACLDREVASGEFPEEHQVRLRLDRLWDEVNGSLNYPWTVDEMAKRLELSPAQFRRVVAKHHGHAPLEMLQRLRMDRAQQLLRRTDDSLTQIAERVGYESPFSLSRTFKRVCGLSPRDYRKGGYPSRAGR